jgi:hypothetical protein
LALALPSRGPWELRRSSKGHPESVCLGVSFSKATIQLSSTFISKQGRVKEGMVDAFVRKMRLQIEKHKK